MGDEYRIGLRIARWRDINGMTQQQLADRIGVSREYVSMIESGARHITKRSLLTAVATALGVSTAELAGSPAAPGSRDSLLAELAPRLRTALDEELEDPPPRVDPGRLAHEVETVMVARMRCDYATVAARLPQLIVEARTLAGLSGADRDTGLMCLVRICHTAAMAIKSFGYVDLGVRFAAQAQGAARQLDDPVAVAAADYTAAQCALTAGAPRRSLTLSTRAAARLGDHGDNDALHWYGMLHLNSAFAAAVIGLRHDTLAHLAESASTAARVWGNPWHVEFGQVNVELWRMGCALELGDVEQVPVLARKIDRSQIQTVHRRARLHIDVGRGLHAVGDSGSAVRQLLFADELAAHEVRSRPWVRQVVADMVRQARRRRGDTALRELAVRVGVDPLDPPENLT